MAAHSVFCEDAADKTGFLATVFVPPSQHASNVATSSRNIITGEDCTFSVKAFVTVELSLVYRNGAMKTTYLRASLKVIQ